MSAYDPNLTCHKWIKDFLPPDKEVTLEFANRILVNRLIGGIIFLGILIVIGLVGNVHVIYVYCRKFKNSNYRIYVLWLAILDIFNLSVSAPLVIIYLCYPVTFQSEEFCKIYRFILYFVSICSTCALVVIAVDRCRKVTAPLGTQITSRQARLMCASCLVVSLVFSWPSLILYGITKVPTGIPGLMGYRCLASGETLKYLAVFHICHILFFLAVSSALIGIYVAIGRKIYKHTFFQDSVRRGSDRFAEESPQLKAKNDNRPSHISQATLFRTTGTLFTVTLAYILSAIPHHVLSIIFFANPSFDCSLTLLEGQFYYTFIWSYFINSAINPFIYSFRDSKFRHELKVIYGLME
ncbi:adenosine receptor A1-like isoform X2 [Saccostrea cucullata]